MGQARGWYLYGIVQQVPSDGDVAASPLRHSSEDIQFLQHAGVAAVVRSVQLADFAPEAIHARLHDMRWLEMMATHHHQVIESIHSVRPMLPVTFGCVYPDEAGLRAALADVRETLLTRLKWVADCDEWTVRLYGNTTCLERRLIQQDARLQHLQDEIKRVAPGRAYLLRHKLVGELAKAMEQTLATWTENEFARLSQTARASLIQPEATDTGRSGRQGEKELLRAVFLVPRVDLATFHQEVERIAARNEGMRGECSGPWPPYSFAALEED